MQTIDAVGGRASPRHIERRLRAPLGLRGTHIATQPGEGCLLDALVCEERLCLGVAASARDQLMYLVLFTGHRNTEKGSPSWFEELLVAPGEHGGSANESARAT